MSRPVEAIVSLANIRANYALAARLAPDSQVLAVIKANAYGHGAARVAVALDTADAFGVASVAEAIVLRDAGITQPIVLLGGVFEPAEIHEVEVYGLQTVIHSSAQLEWFLSRKSAARLVIWLKMDIGMHRLGFTPQEYTAAWQRLSDSGQVQELVLMSHFPCADHGDDTLTKSQVQVFNEGVAGLNGQKSMANSAALIRYPESRYNWVRPGIMLYGANPFPDQNLLGINLEPAMTLRSRLVSVRELAAGESVGYGQRWRTTVPIRLGTVAVGYGDGYPRHAVDGTPVLVRGKRCRLVGRVSMDFITVDLSEAPDSRVDDEVILWGDSLPVEQVAEFAGTISYDLLTGVTQRVKYLYSD